MVKSWWNRKKIHFLQSFNLFTNFYKVFYLCMNFVCFYSCWLKISKQKLNFSVLNNKQHFIATPIQEIVQKRIDVPLYHSHGVGIENCLFKFSLNRVMCDAWVATIHEKLSLLCYSSIWLVEIMRSLYHRGIWLASAPDAVCLNEFPNCRASSNWSFLPREHSTGFVNFFQIFGHNFHCFQEISPFWFLAAFFVRRQRNR